jgi:hypothetical protein
MKDVMRDASFAMSYNSRHDEIYLDSREGDGFHWHFEFCPFCGKDIEGKSEVLRKVIGEEFGINTELDDFDWDLLDQLPPEFQTDEWWKKRGL